MPTTALANERDELNETDLIYSHFAANDIHISMCGVNTPLSNQTAFK